MIHHIYSRNQVTAMFFTQRTARGAALVASAALGLGGVFVPATLAPGTFASAAYAQTQQATQPESVATANNAESQFDHVLPEDDPRRHYSLPRNTRFDRVRDISAEQPQDNTANPVLAARLRVEETVVPENDSEKTLTVRGEGFTGVSTVQLKVSAVDEQGAVTGEVIATADVSEIDSTGAFTAQVQIPGSALKPGTTYRVSAVAEDEQGTVRMVNGGFTVERDSVDNTPATPEASDSESSAPKADVPVANTPEVTAPAQTPAADASAPAEPAESAPAESAPVADQASATEQKAGESATEQKNDVSVTVQEAEAQKGSEQKREKLAATGASNVLVISAAGSLSLLAGMRLSRRRRSEMRLSSRR